MYYNQFSPYPSMDPYGRAPNMQNNRPAQSFQTMQTPQVQQNMQQVQQPSYPQSQPIYGRMVNTAEEITPQEVPMDGTVSLFPKNDYSCIYAKMWNTDGTIRTVTFIPEMGEQAPQENPIIAEFNKINERLDKIERNLTKRNRPYKKHQNKGELNNEQSNFKPDRETLE